MNCQLYHAKIRGLRTIRYLLLNNSDSYLTWWNEAQKEAPQKLASSPPVQLNPKLEQLLIDLLQVRVGDAATGECAEVGDMVQREDASSIYCRSFGAEEIGAVDLIENECRPLVGVLVGDLDVGEFHIAR